MQILEMPPGQSAPEGADRIIITLLKDGTFQVDGVIAADTVAIYFSPAPFASDADALTAALAWACDKETDLVVIERHSVSSWRKRTLSRQGHLMAGAKPPHSCPQ